MDVVVVGGGPAGSACAIALATAGASVAVIDGSSSPGPRGGDVVPPDVRPELAALGLWDTFAAAGHLPSPGMRSAWGQADAIARDFVFGPYGDAWHVDRERFDEMLLSAAERAGASVWRGARAGAAVPDGEGWRVEVGTSSVWGRYVVEATGRGSPVAGSPRAPRTVIDRLVGVVATVEADDGDRRMLLEATEIGWWYVAPLPGDRLVAGWMTDPDVPARPGGARLRDLWRGELERTVFARDRVPEPAGARPAVVAASSSCRPAACGTWLAVGDAAAAYDPLSGQGIVRALRTGREAASAVLGADDGARDALEFYAQSVAADFDLYLQLRQEYYGAEQRWPAALFWRRRHVSPSL